MIKQFISSAAIALAACAVQAENMSAEQKAQFQSAMIAHVENVSVDGAYTYLDTKTGSIKTVFPANVHPFVVQVGPNVFVCSEMITEDGETVTADFMVANIDGELRVVQMLVNNRDALKAAMKKTGS